MPIHQVSLDLGLESGDILDVFPGGPTYLLNPGRTLPRTTYPDLDDAIMIAGQKGQLPAFQQGGLLERPENDQALVRLQMAHGELCLNGIRSLGFCMAHDLVNGSIRMASAWTPKRPPILRSAGKSFQGWIPIEASGDRGLFRVEVRLRKGVPDGWAGVAVPLGGHDPLGNVRVDVDGRPGEATLVRLGGITHLVLDGRFRPFPGPEAANPIVLRLARLLANCHQGVFGVIWIQPQPDGRTRMDPVVHLATHPPQFFYEQSCGSGAAAVGMAMAEARSVRGAYRYSLVPPSQVPIITRGCRDPKPKAFHSVWIEGPVRLRGIYRFHAPHLTKKPNQTQMTDE